jgi:CheY-like chemotaxis protein
MSLTNCYKTTSKKLNIDTIQVSSGKEALEWLTNYKRENDFLVILLDIKMPEMDGFEF